MGISLRDALDVQKASKWQKFQAEIGRKVYLGHETRLSWTGRLPFYLFQCPRCKKLVKNYPHGFPHNQYLSCLECGARIDFVRFLYGLITFFSMIFLVFKMRFRKKS